MTLRVSGKNLDIGEALRQHVLGKVEAAVARYFGGSVGAHVAVTREGSGYRSDCMLRLSSGVSLHAQGRAHEPSLCFDQAADKIEGRLRRYKMWLKDHAGVPASARGKVANYVLEPPEDEEEPAGGFEPVVVAEGIDELKSLSVGAATARSGGSIRRPRANRQ